MSVVPTLMMRQDLSRRHRLVYRVDINPEDIPILSGEEPNLEPHDDTPIIEAGYASTPDFSSPIARKSRDTTKMSELPNPEDTSILGDKAEITDPTALSSPEDVVEEYENITPSAVVDYYNETALKSKQRNALPDSEFGLPRLRAYPLNDRAHVRQAVRMFGHCKDPEDRKILAGNIFKAAKKHDVELKIGKKNPLYQYAPEALQEAAGIKDGSSIPSAISIGASIEKRTKDDIVREHLQTNRLFYNNIFYGPDYMKSLKAISFKFLDFFYPDVGRMSFQARLECVCGGLAGGGSRDEIYSALGIRNPLCVDFTKELGWCTTDQSDSAINVFINSNYFDSSNWFKVDLSNDPDHILFCLRLYSVMGEMFLDPNFNPDIHLTDKHFALLMDWNQRVGYHYDLYLDADTEAERMREIQYLFDMYWTFTDNPNNDSDINVNTIAMLRNMACINGAVESVNEANVSGELISADQCNAYLVHDLGMDDSLYLLPSTLEYPVVSKESIRLAMDLIWRVDKEQRQEFAENLNRKYKEFGCTFSISVDHPYAPYADKNIVSHMTRVLLEGDTAVDDEGTSTGDPPMSEQPWYKRLDVVRGTSANILDNKELGPNNKKQVDEPDYIQPDTFK